jgi:hypothetical protein
MSRFHWEVIAAPLAAVPLVLALAIVGGWAIHTQNRLHDQVAEARALESTNDQLWTENLTLHNVIRSEQTNWWLSGTDTEIGGNAMGKLTMFGEGELYANLEVWNLPTSQESYQVILETKDGRVHRAATFEIDSSGSASVPLDMTDPIDGYRSIHVKPVSVNDSPSTSDSFTPDDVLWMDLESDLGGSGGTEANAKAK